MKKVAIMSMHRIINYGSFLQAYGLYSTIKKLGYETKFIDYHYDGCLIEDKKKSIFHKIMKNLNIFKFIKKKKLYINFRNQINNNLNIMGISHEYDYSKDFSTLVIGSDEVFNCVQGYPVGYSLELFGKNFEDKNVISYAASFGYTNIEKLEKYGVEQEIGDLLKKFKNISVRDENSAKIVKSLCKVTPEINLDPVLISDYSDKISDKRPLDNYIIIYAYSGRLSKDEEKYIKAFAKKYNKKIVSLGFFQKIADYNIAVSPFEVLNYFKYADYIITDTFHGSVFSIKMNSKFCTIIRKANENKLKYLLKKLLRTDREVNKLEDIEKLYNTEINYKDTNEIIKKETEKTIEYLRQNI